MKCNRRLRGFAVKFECDSAVSEGIGLLQQTITWYKIRHTGGQAHCYSRTGTVKQRDANQSSVTGHCFFFRHGVDFIFSHGLDLYQIPLLYFIKR